MIERKISLIILISFLSILWASQVLSLEKETHQALNENIANRTINSFSLNDYLVSVY